MASLPSVAQLDAARARARTSPDDHVWHFVLHRAGTDPRRGERLATLALSPEDVTRIGRAELGETLAILTPSGEDAHAVGLRVLGRALDLERREWVRRTMKLGYVDGWGVAIVAERGYRRTVFPGIGTMGLRTPRIAVAPRIATGGGTPA